MRRALIWIGRGFVAAVAIAVALGVWKRDDLVRLHAVNTLFAEDRIVGNFSAMDRAFWTVEIPAPPTARPLPEALRPLPETFDFDGRRIATEDWLARGAVTSLLVLKDGAVTHESHRLGTGPEDLRIGWSMTKSVVAALFGPALASGAVASLDDPVTAHVPALAGSAYDGARVRDVLHMASGVEFDEDYGDFRSDINRMGRTLALGFSMDAFAAGQDRRLRGPGEAFQYVSIDTHVLAMVLREATGRAFEDLVAEQVWAPMGAEAPARLITDAHGAPFALGGLNARTRDWARFGLWIAEAAAADPEGWAARMLTASAPPSDQMRGWNYGLHWWIPRDAEAEALARGVYGQMLYLRPAEGLVIVKTAADRDFMAEGGRSYFESLAAFRAIAADLR